MHIFCHIFIAFTLHHILSPTYLQLLGLYLILYHLRPLFDHSCLYTCRKIDGKRDMIPLTKLIAWSRDIQRTESNDAVTGVYFCFLVWIRWTFDCLPRKFLERGKGYFPLNEELEGEDIQAVCKRRKWRKADRLRLHSHMNILEESGA
ncbi:hypothetical protein F4776DRAFT_274061 [Hypoxylon sp. NC0597]|nr:hypothetical protein F4776DRAFT_274061 [Hypoxylon sp. NC0597]